MLEDTQDNAQDNTQDNEQRRATEPETNGGTGHPGGGTGRRDVSGQTGVFPVSEMEGAAGEAEIQPETSWGQGALGTEGYEESGDSGLFGLPGMPAVESDTTLSEHTDERDQ